ncbi:MAG: hypothetical protein HS104_09360 [Polyangiaceae bacterium]|nr:hypothetical protein [Polyangiaceae bacterium]MCL4754089.1 hypothetical protein [Myxococcales bacterium]
MRSHWLSGVLLGLCAAGAAMSCAGGDDADDKPSTGGKGGTGGSGGTNFGGGGFGGGVGATGGSGGSGGSGATGGSSGSGGSGATGGSGGDASLDSPSDVSADVTPDVEAGPDAGNCIPPADAGSAPDAGCATGQYWNPCKQTCAPCTDLSWLAFGDPVAKVAGLSSSADDLFPRITTLTSTDRVVLRRNSSNELDLYTATAQGTGWTALTNNLGNLVNYPNQEDSGPVIIPTGAVDPSNGTTTTEPFVLFDSKRNGKLQLFTSQLFKSAGSPAPLGAPLNQSTSGSRDYNPAYAYLGGNARLYWISDRNSKPGLYTFPVAGGSVAQVPLTFENGCAVIDEDLEPWVTPDGTVLFFSSPRHDQPNCALAVNGGVRALFYTYMDPTTGQQIGTAKELKAVRTAVETSVAKTNVSLRTPSLSPGFCSLYFSTDAHVEGGVDFDVFTAAR